MSTALRIWTLGIALFLTLLVAALLFMGQIGKKSSLYARTARFTREMLSEYIEKNSGSFPVSQQDLFEQGFLRQASDGQYEYCVGGKNEERSLSLPMFEQFDIAYGASASELELKDGVLRDKDTGGEILLIKGPESSRKYIVWPYYRSESRLLYELMTRLNESSSRQGPLEEDGPTSLGG